MKKRFPIIIIVFIMIAASLACRFPWQTESPPEPGTETPIETATMPPVETATSTETTSPSLTPTETPGVTLPVFPNPVIFELNMFTPLEGWAVTQDNDRLLRTVDGGQTWLDATPAELHPLPPDVTSLWIQPFFLDEDTVWFSASSLGTGLYHTVDGGKTWTITALPFERARYYFVDLSLGYAVVDLGAGAGSQYIAIYRTLDGGATWTEVFTHEPGESKSLPESGSKSGITFLDRDHGWIGGTYPMTDYFYLHYTVDGGVTWTRDTEISLPGAYSGSWLEVHQPTFVSATVGYLTVRALAPDNNTYLLVYRSDDSGQSWIFRNSVLDGRAIDFTSTDEGWLAASTQIFQTADGGLTWSPVSISSGPVGEYFLAVDFVDDQHGWVIATPDDSTWDPRKLYRTTDGGVNWAQLVP